VTRCDPPHGEPRARRVLITTSFDLPGYDIVGVQGEVFGLNVRSRNIGPATSPGCGPCVAATSPKFAKLLGSVGPSTASRPDRGREPPVASDERPP
jgi:hypothetical protein